MFIGACNKKLLYALRCFALIAHSGVSVLCEAAAGGWCKVCLGFSRSVLLRVSPIVCLQERGVQ